MTIFLFSNPQRPVACKTYATTMQVSHCYGYFDMSESQCDCKLTQLQSDATGMLLPHNTPQQTAVRDHS